MFTSKRVPCILYCSIFVNYNFTFLTPEKYRLPSKLKSKKKGQQMKTQMTWVEIICISNRKIISTQQLHPRVDDSGGNTVNRFIETFLLKMEHQDGHRLRGFLFGLMD